MRTLPLKSYPASPTPSANADASPLGPGSLVGGKYRVERLLGRGGMGEVYLAIHEQLGRRVAIKVLLAESARDPGVRTRFRREAVAASTLASTHIAEVSDVGELPPPRAGAVGLPYMVMEYLQGRDLSAHLAERGALGVHEAIDILTQLCEGVRVAHVAGVVHRDLKPANLFLVPRPGGAPLVKILDFGIAKAEGSLGARDSQALQGRASGVAMTQLTSFGGMLGSARYMAPEQMESARDVDGRADIWSIGVIGFKLLTGRAPFEADTAEALFVAMITEPHVPLASIRSDLPPALIEAIEGCLRPIREERWPTVEALASRLAQAMSYGERPSFGYLPPTELAYELPLSHRLSLTHAPRLSEPGGMADSPAQSLPLYRAHPPHPPQRTLVALVVVAGLGLSLLVLTGMIFFAWRSLVVQVLASAAGGPRVMPGYTLADTVVDPVQLLPKAQAEAASLLPGEPLSLVDLSVYNASEGPLRLSGETMVTFVLARAGAEEGAMVSFSATGVFKQKKELRDEPRLSIPPRCSFLAARNAATAAGYVHTPKNAASYGEALPNAWRFHNLGRKPTVPFVDVDGATCAIRKR